MLECIQSLGTAYKDANKDIVMDYEYEFYKTYLKGFEGQESQNGLIKVTGDLEAAFLELSSLYSNYVEVENRGYEDQLADSLAYYVSTGVIKLQKDGYYIDVKKLSETTKQYNTTKEQIGNALKKGGIK